MTQPTRTEYRIGPPELKWQVGMLGERVVASSDEVLRFSVAADAAGYPVDPTGAAVEVGFKTSFVQPVGAEWIEGFWDRTLTGTYVACVRSGVTGAALAAGRHYVWVRITAPDSGEIVIRQTGTVLVS